MDPSGTNQYTNTVTQTAAPQPRFDPMTGRPLQPQPRFDQMTGRPLQPQPRFDQMTGRPLQPQPKFDPTTGQPLQPQPKFDPMTGKPLQPQPRFDQITGQPLQQAAPQPARSVPAAPNKNEFFVGINLLSKIGVIFIIIGVIAFSAVSGDFLSPFVRTAINFVLGLLMTGLGEVFYRMRSAIFARALTIGGIGVLAVSVLIGYNAFETLNELAALLIGMFISAGGLALGIRYKSQTITAVTILSGILPCYVSGNEIISLIGTMVYLVLLQTAVMVICSKKAWKIPPFFALVGSLIISPFLFLTLGISIDATLETAQLLSAIYTVASLGVYVSAVVIDSFHNNGRLSAHNIALFTVSTALAVILCLCYFVFGESMMIFGFISLFIALAYIALAGAAKAHIGSCDLIKILLHTALALICISIFTIFSGDLIYIIFHICAAALLIVAYITNIRFLKTWGIITCSFAEFYFVTFCVINIEEVIFIYQFAVNSLLWLIILTTLAIRGIRSTGFTIYSICTLINTGLMGCYMALRMFIYLGEEEILSTGAAVILLISLSSALIWMLIAFVTGKLRFMNKAAPITAIVIYGFAILSLLNTNFISPFANLSNNVICIIASIAVNVISVLAALDMSLCIKGLAPKFARAIALVVSLYAMLSLTIALGANQLVAFTNCLISIFYLIIAVIWIIWGFVRHFPLMRRFGLALALLSSAKLFLVDFAGTDAVGRTIMFILFGIVLLVVSFIYAIFEKKIKEQEIQKTQTTQNIQ